MDGEGNIDLLDIFIGSIIFIAGLYLVLHLGYALDSTSVNKKVELLVAIEQFENTISKKPLAFTNQNFKGDNIAKVFLMMYLAASTCAALYYLTLNKKYMKGKEYGSARWGTKKEAKELQDKPTKEQLKVIKETGIDNNVILSEHVQMSLNTMHTNRNANVLIVGGSGSGKTRYEVKPNIMQLNTSYVVTDPKGEVQRDTRKMLEENDYEVRVINLIHMQHSNNYNPLHYIDYFKKGNSEADKDIIKLINTLMKNTTGDGEKKGADDPFWEKAERMLLMAIISYLYYEAPEHERNFGMVIDLVRCAQASEEEEGFESILDILFKDLKEEKPDHIAVQYYGDFKKAAGKTLKSIIISVLARLGIWAIDQVKDLMCTDTIDIPSIGEKKTALFIIIPDRDDTFNSIISMFYSQMFDILYDLADFKYDGKLPYHTRCILDEFANIGVIPSFVKLISTMRSREISAVPIIQDFAQLETTYKNSWKTIKGNCETVVFLGGKEDTTLKSISTSLGKMTIDTSNRSISRGSKNNSSSVQEGKIGRELMTVDELEKMSKKKCIVLVSGCYPFRDKKYNLKKHKRYKELGDAAPENKFDYRDVHVITKEKNEKKYNNQQSNYTTPKDYGIEAKELEVTEEDYYVDDFEKEDEEKIQIISDILGDKFVVNDFSPSQDDQYVEDYEII